VNNQTEYKGSLEGVRAMLSSEMIGKMLLERAEQIAVRARSLAPVGDPDTDPHSGRYKNSFKVRLSFDASRKRMQAVVYNDSPEAIFVEKGTVNQDPQHILIRASMAARI